MSDRRFVSALILFTLALSTVICGCGPVGWTRVTVNHRLTPKDVAFITPGVTKWDEVIKRLGVPSEIDDSPEGIVINYYYFDGREFSADPGWPLNFVGPLAYAPHSMTLRNAGLGMDKFQVAFDQKGTVIYAAFAHRLAVSQYKAWPFESRIP